MNRVISVNLGGNAWQLEEDGYDALRGYLQDAEARLCANPDKAEIMSDIEASIAERFKGYLSEYKTVILFPEVEAVLTQMGPVESDESAEPESEDSFRGRERPAGMQPRKLYRLKKGAMLAGVCNGLGAYLDVDQTVIRLLFAAAALLGGIGVFAYIVMTIVVPLAETPEQIAAATTGRSTAQEFIRMARDGYYEEMKRHAGDRKTRREWQRRFKREMKENARQWKYAMKYQWAQYSPSAGVFLPVASILHGALKVLWICATVSILATGGIFGKPLPAAIPAWLAVVILFFTYGAVVSPLKGITHVSKRGSRGHSWSWGVSFALSRFVHVAVLALLVVLVIHNFPEIKAAVHNAPAMFHSAVADIRAWWKG